MNMTLWIIEDFDSDLNEVSGREILTYLDIKLAEITITEFLYAEIMRVKQKSFVNDGDPPPTADFVNVSHRTT